MAVDQLAGTDVEAQPDDLRASIEAEFTKAETPADTSAPVEAAPTEMAAPETPTDTKGDHPTDEKRYADGTFKPIKTEAAPEKAAPVKTDQPSTDNQTKASAVAATQPDAPPAGWTADGKAAWSVLAKELPTLPPAVQTAVRTMQMAAIKREEVAAAGSHQWSEEKRRYEGMISPIARLAQLRGMSAEQGASLLASAQDALDRNPADGIRRIAQSYGVDLATLAGKPANGSSEVSQQPDIQALVRQAVAPIIAPLQERFAAEERQKIDSTTALVDQFAASPGHEHYRAVEDVILAILPKVMAEKPSWTHEQKLQEAYDRAVYANPETRKVILATQAADADKKRQTEAAERAKNARTAASSVTGVPSGAPAQKVHDSIRGELEAAFAGS